MDLRVIWSKKRKNISHYVDQLIRVFYSQAGISPTIKPQLPHLPAVSSTQTELSHLIMNHIIPRGSESVLSSFPHYSTNEVIKQILFKAFATVCRCKYRPKDSAKSHLRDAFEATQSSLKSLHTYRSGFEIAVNGTCLGLNLYALSLLQRIITWVGLFLCDTWDDDMVKFMIKEVHKISILCDESPHLTAFTQKTPCLRTWVNMVDICLYWCENANVFMGLKYERGNKITTEQ